MANARRGERDRSPVRFPAILFLLFLALVAGTLIWLTLASPGWEDARQPTGPRFDIAVGVPSTPAKPEQKITVPEPETPAPEPETPAPKTEKPAPEPEKPAPEPEKPAPEQAESEPEKIKPAEQKAADKPAPPDKPPALPPKELPGVLDSDLLLPPPMPELPPLPPVEPLTAGPDPALMQQTPAGPLPAIAPDGRESWRVYARPFDNPDERPRIAIVITGLGINTRTTETAVHGLPGQVTLAFVPYADRLPRWIALARAAGHEVMLAVPMEPIDFPQEDPGPQALLMSLTPGDNLKRLEWALSRANGYIGITNFLGSAFTRSRKQMRAMMHSLKARGLMFLDSYSAPASVASDLASEIGVPWANNEVFIDDKTSGMAIDTKLEKVEHLAREEGFAIAIGNGYPVTIERVAKWASKIEQRGFVLAPISALANTTVEQ